LDGNSNGFEFLIYDLEGFFKEREMEIDSECNELKAQIKRSEGLLRAEVRLVESPAIRALTDRLVASEQVVELCGKGRKVFLDVFQWVVPFGHYYKKEEALEIIREEVKDPKIKRRMMQLVGLVPEKKSLLLAQKALSYRRIDEVMAEFAAIEVSPVTISKRHNIKTLYNLYKYL